MPARPVDAVWFWPYTTAPFRAAYGRLGSPYSKDYLQTSGDCSDVFDSKTGRSGQERYHVEYSWPGGATTDVVKPGGGYNPPHDLRLNFRWPYSQAPAPWKLSLQPGPVAAFPGDPSKTTKAEADAELARFLAGGFDPWILAVKLRDDDHRLHVRAYMGTPPPDRRYASVQALPQPLLATMRGLIRGGCGTYVPGRQGQGAIVFDPDRMFDAWPDAVGAVPPPPDTGVILVADGDPSIGDNTGLEFELPARLLANVVAGAPFVYFRNADAAETARYFGAGVIGDITESATPGSLICEIVGYRSFEKPVPAQTPEGTYLEPDGASPGYLENPARIVPISVLEAIIDRSALADEAASVVAGPEAARPRAYPSSEYSRRVDAYAIEVAAAEVLRRFPTADVRRMAHNNPGYDIRVSEGNTVIRFVEVKGTSGDRGAFFLSEGERQFSVRNESRFSLCVVLRINLDRRTHEISWHDGLVDEAGFELTVRQWQGRVPQH